jgi:transposase-like protein
VEKYSPLLEAQFQKKKKSVGSSWRVDETYIKVNGKWKYLYRAVDKEGNTVDFLLTAKRDKKAALRYLNKAVKRNGAPEKITIDKSGANRAAAESYNETAEKPAKIRDVKYLNNIVEQDHRGIKRITKPMMGFKSFNSAQKTLKGIELARMIKKGQMKDAGNMTPAEQFYSLAA